MAKEKWKGKDWYEIKAPDFFKGIIIGETTAMDPNLIKGRVIETSLIELTGDPSKYYIKLFFKVIDVNGSTANTKFFGHTCTKDYIARIVQVRTSRIDTNDVVQLADGKMRIKAIAICNRRVKISLGTTIRKAMSELIKKNISKMTIKDFVKSMIEGKIQNKVKKDISKLYPLRFFEFKKTQIIE